MVNNSNFYIIIMAGGIGSRFWPASRESRPKQFLDITASGQSLLQQTFTRACLLVPEQNIYVLSVEDYKDLILKQLVGLNESQLLLEPTRNNTAPCIAYAALHLQSKNKDAVFAVIPSDHIVKKEDVFTKCMNLGFQHAEKSRDIVTLGITPSRPDTGYGYILFDNNIEAGGLYSVLAFKEKPSQEKAKEYLSSGRYLWNAGIFIWSTQTLLQAYRDFAPDILNTLAEDLSKYGTRNEKGYLAHVYPKTRKVSVDYAILEYAKNVKTIPADIGWSDLGTWNSLYDYMKKDEEGNVVLADQNLLLNSKNCLIRINDQDKLVVLKGLKDYIVVDEGDVLLIYPREEEQEIKKVRASIENKKYV